MTKCWMEDEWSRGAWTFVGFSNFAMAIAREGGFISRVNISRSGLRGCRGAGVRVEGGERD